MRKLIEKAFVGMQKWLIYGKDLILKNKILVVMGIVIVVSAFLDGTICPYKSILGIPCPGCGMTRAYESLLHFDFKDAFFYHPLFVLPAFFAFVMLFKHKKYVNLIYKCNALWIVICVITILTWIIRLILFFPHTAPMDFNKNAIIIRAFSFISKKVF